MSKTTFAQHAVMGTVGAALAVMIFATPTAAWADPSTDGSSTGTGSAAASDNKPGTGSAPASDNKPGDGSPTFNTPVSIPSVGDAPAKPKATATQAEKDAYAAAKASYDAQVQARALAQSAEYARLQAIKARAEAQAIQSHGK